MRYRLRTLNVMLAAGPPFLAVLWFLSHSILGMIAWAAIIGLFVAWYLMLRKSQALRDECE